MTTTEHGVSPDDRWSTARRTSRTSRLVAGCAWLYAAAIVTVLGALRFGGDRWWWATVLLFAPRWIYALPLALLVPGALLYRRRVLLVLGASTLVAIGPVMGFCCPWPVRTSASGASLRVMTCNLCGRSGNVGPIEDLTHDIEADVMVFQECPDDVALAIENLIGWHVDRQGWLCVASRHPLRAAGQPLSDAGELGYWGTYAAKYTVEAPGGDCEVLAVHLETPREGFESLRRHGFGARRDVVQDIERRATISRRARELTQQGSQPLIVAGDFNMPCDSGIYRRDWADMTNAFSAAGFGFGNSKRTRWYGIRIDHVLAGPGWQVERAWIGPHVGSDHRPVIADLKKMREE